MLEEKLLAPERQSACSAAAFGRMVNDCDHGRLVRQRRRRSVISNPGSGTIEQSANRPPIADQSGRGSKRTAVTLRHRERLERVPGGDQSRFRFRRAGRARQRADGSGKTNEVEPLALETVGGAGQPIADRALGAALEGNFDQTGVAAVETAQQMDRVGNIAA